ncbi:ribonuclease H-like domain-containing protein, partial [Tanacetum coccineum]
SYAVQQVCLYMHDPREPHFSALKRILRYIRGTIDHGLQLFSASTTSLVAYSDADWAGCPTTRRSTSGYCVFLGNNLLSWSSKRQHTLSRSSAEAEYRGVANAVAETCWLRNLLRELHTPLTTATLMYCDNVSAVYLSSNPVQHQRTKHIEIDIHFVRDLVAAGHIRVLHVPSRYQFADIFTKGLPSALFEEFRSSLSVRCTPTPTAGEGDPPRFLQLYIYNTNNEVSNRMHHFGGENFRKLSLEIVQHLTEVLDIYNEATRVREYEFPTSLTLGGIDYDVIIQMKDGVSQRINKLHPSYTSLQFSHLFLFGQSGFHPDLKLKKANENAVGKRMSMNIIEQNCIDYVRAKQNDIRNKTPSRGDHDGSDVKTRIILPLSFYRGPRYMYNHYLDALAVC